MGYDSELINYSQTKQENGILTYYLTNSPLKSMSVAKELLTALGWEGFASPETCFPIKRKKFIAELTKENPQYITYKLITIYAYKPWGKSSEGRSMHTSSSRLSAFLWHQQSCFFMKLLGWKQRGSKKKWNIPYFNPGLALECKYCAWSW